MMNEPAGLTQYVGGNLGYSPLLPSPKVPIDVLVPPVRLFSPLRRPVTDDTAIGDRYPTQRFCLPVSLSVACSIYSTAMLACSEGGSAAGRHRLKVRCRCATWCACTQILVQPLRQAGCGCSQQFRSGPPRSTCRMHPAVAPRFWPRPISPHMRETAQLRMAGRSRKSSVCIADCQIPGLRLSRTPPQLMPWTATNHGMRLHQDLAVPRICQMGSQSHPSHQGQPMVH